MKETREQKINSPDSEKIVSLVVPFFNEEDGVENFIHNVLPVIDNIPTVVFEVVCIDDGSHDSTLQKLCAQVDQDNRFRVVELTRNFGKEAALTAGIDVACGDAVIPMDADLQDPPEFIPLLIEEWRQGAEVVVARRADRSSDSYLKRKTASLFYQVHNRLADVPLPENVGDFRLMDRVTVEALKALPERQRFMKGLFAWVGFKTVSIDYTRKRRSNGSSKFSGWKLWNFALEGITSFSTTPLKMWTYAGSLGALVTFCYAVFIVLRTLIYGVDVPGYASLLVAIIFFGSLQLISIGILGEYIGRIYMESKKRPLYLIRRQYENKERQ